MASVERSFVRMTFWQTVLSLVGVFIAVIALYAALKESAAVRQQTAAAVWPFVQLMVEDYDTGDRAGFSLSFKNVGVGPARVRSISLIIAGEVIRDWSNMVEVVGGDPASPVNRNFLRGRVLPPDERVELIGTSAPDLARKLQAAVAGPDKRIRYCYCSIFDECWLVDSQRDVQYPQPVAACPDFGADAFDISRRPMPSP
jgi:hypothetical protein